MKVLHVAFSDGRGGAGIAARRLHQSLRSNVADMDSELIVFDKVTEFVEVTQVRKGLLNFLYSKLVNRICEFLISLDNKLSSNRSFHPRSLNIFPSNIVKYINSQNADVVHLHWINGELIPVYELKNIQCENVIYTLHDCWPLLGTSHHPTDCLDITRDVPYSYNKSTNVDSWLDRFVFRQKIKAYNKINPIFIAPSVWMKGVLRSCSFFDAFRCEIIPNLVPEEVFKQRAKYTDSNIGPIIIGIGAVNPFSNENKGFKDLLSILSSIPKDTFKFLVLGTDKIDSTFTNFEKKGLIQAYGVVESDLEIGEFMRSCNFFLSLSRVESFGFTACEAISNGTPVLSYLTTGSTDIVRHGVSGYLATDIHEMIENITRCSELTKDEYLALQISAKEYFSTNFSPKTVVEQHVNLYRELINK